MKTLLIGDIHADFEFYVNATETPAPTIQLGDFGLGFPGNDFRFKYGFSPVNENQLDEFWLAEPRHKIIRGNHDNPLNFKTCPGYMGDFGFCEKRNLFWLSGAFSIDWEVRKPGYNWWYDEELAIPQLNEAYELYMACKPRFVISHDCPVVCVPRLIAAERRVNPEKVRVFDSRTSQALSKMFEMHKPENWYFGHYHYSWKDCIEGTNFECVASNKIVEACF